MALFDFKGFFVKNQEGYDSEASNALSLTERRKQFNEQESEEALNRRKLKSLLAEVGEGGLGSLLGGGTGTGTGNFTGTGSIQQQVWQYFTSAGYTKEAVAGMMGNIEAESSFIITNVNSSSAAYGLVQWMAGRRKNLQNHAKSMNLTEGDIEAQLSFLLHELESGDGWISPNIFYPRVHEFSKFKQASDVTYAAEAFAESFERMSVSEYEQSYNKRINAAKKYYDEFKNWTPPVGGKATGQFINPNTGKITSPFGMRTLDGQQKLHAGIDIVDAQVAERSIVASEGGTVEFVKDSGTAGYGKHLKIDHGTVNGIRMTTLYAHFESISVSSGQSVAQGDFLGVRGTTGYSTGEHLHFEVHENGNPVDPLKYVSYDSF